jgi:hypothetical protein
MTQRTQFDRAYTTGVEVSAPQPEGTPFVNFPDRKLQVQGPTGPIDLLAIRLFSDQADYASGDVVVYAGGLYAASAPITAGAFNPADWTSLVADVFNPLTGAVGWDFTLTYTGDDVTEVLSSNADARVRQTIVYDADGNPEVVLYYTSVNAGADWTLIGTLNITYDADSNPQSGAWT